MNFMRFDNATRKPQGPKADQSHRPSKLAKFAKYALPVLLLFAPASAGAHLTVVSPQPAKSSTAPNPGLLRPVLICDGFGQDAKCKPTKCEVSSEKPGRLLVLKCEPEKKQDAAVQEKSETTECAKQDEETKEIVGAWQYLKSVFSPCSAIIVAAYALLAIVKRKFGSARNFDSENEEKP